jgi:N-acetylmuramoyl-L-alanine amidase
VKGSALVNRVQVSPNIEPRLDGKIPRFLILHYTGMASGKAAVDWLCNTASKVSCHYLVDDDGAIVQMVDEDLRAWHAGVGSWQGEIDINSASIGIEIQNEGHAAGSPSFPTIQMQRVAELCRDVMQRHAIPPQNVLAHSDIAPGRKIDPGEQFDWDWLAGQGVGVVVKAAGGGDLMDGMTLQQNLSQLGYGINTTTKVKEAFQRHFRRSKVDGVADGETCDVLRRLLAIQKAPIALRALPQQVGEGLVADTSLKS